MALFQSLKEIIADLLDRRCVIQPDAALEMLVQAAVVEVDGSDNREFVISHERLAVHETGVYS